jgi:hypothetical protein
VLGNRAYPGHQRICASVRQGIPDGVRPRDHRRRGAGPQMGARDGGGTTVALGQWRSNSCAMRPSHSSSRGATFLQPVVAGSSVAGSVRPRSPSVDPRRGWSAVRVWPGPAVPVARFFSDVGLQPVELIDEEIGGCDCPELLAGADDTDGGGVGVELDLDVADDVFGRVPRRRRGLQARRELGELQASWSCMMGVRLRAGGGAVARG